MHLAWVKLKPNILVIGIVLIICLYLPLADFVD